MGNLLTLPASMPKILPPAPGAAIALPTNNRPEPLSPGPVYPFAAVRQPAIPNPPLFGQTELVLRPDPPSGFFRAANVQGVLSEQNHFHGRPKWLKFQRHGSPRPPLRHPFSLR